VHRQEVAAPGRPLEALERHIDLVVSAYESGRGVTWADVEYVLTEGYARVLAAESLCLRNQSSDPDAARLRHALGGFKTRGLDARRRFGEA
jgi:hypothetical protein